MSSPLSVAVLVSAGRHPVSGAPRACRGDAIAMAVGRKIAGETLRVVYAGNEKEPGLGDYFALGAGRIDVLNVAIGRDILDPIAAYLKDTDLILTGACAEHGEGSGLLPYLLADRLGRTMIGGVLDVKFELDEAHVRQFLPKGKRRSVAAPLPLVAAVHPLSPVELTYAHARRVSGRIETVTVSGLADKSRSQAVWTVEPTARRAIALKTPENKDGHARMLSFVESPAKGGAVAFEGTSVDKAQILLTYLRENRLIDF